MSVDWKPPVRWRGFNLLGMFRAPTEGLAPDPRVAGCFPEWEFEALGEWGFNFARLPLDYRALTTGDDWTNLDEAKLALVDGQRTVAVAVDAELHLNVVVAGDVRLDGEDPVAVEAGPGAEHEI